MQESNGFSLPRTSSSACLNRAANVLPHGTQMIGGITSYLTGMRTGYLTPVRRIRLDGDRYAMSTTPSNRIRSASGSLSTPLKREKSALSTPFSSAFKKPPEKPAAGQLTLDAIVTEYFRKQHALCKNPVVTCPPFSAF